MYVRSLVAAEEPGASVGSRTLVRQLQESLGLSLPGMQRLRWHIGDVRGGVLEPAEGSSRPTSKRGTPARDRLKVINGGG